MDYRDYIKNKDIDLSKEDRLFQLSSLITEARVYAGITQAELAKRIGTQQPNIAHAESGEQEPSIGFLEKVAKAVGTYLEYPKFGFMIEQEKSLNVSLYTFVQTNAPAQTSSPKSTVIWRTYVQGTTPNSVFESELPTIALEAIQ